MKATTLYKAAVIIHALSSIAGIVQTFPLLLHGPNDPGNPAIPWIVVVSAALLSVAGVLSAYGAWHGQKWGIWLTVVTEALNGLLALPGDLGFLAVPHRRSGIQGEVLWYRDGEEERVVFHEVDVEVSDGVTVQSIGGHSRGLQAVRVRTAAGWLCLASEAAHYYENLLQRKPFPIVVDLEDMLRGFTTLERLASSRGLVVPGHDPLVRQVFPQEGPEHVFRLDAGPQAPLPV